MSEGPDRAARTIFCCVDESPLASAVAYAAAGFALQLGASVVLIRSAPEISGSDLTKLQLQAELEQLSEQTIQTPTGQRVQTRIVLTVSPLLDAVRALASATPPDLVIMGTRGRGRLRRAMFGSSALSMMRETGLPLLVVPPDGPEIIAVLPDGEPYCHVGHVLIPVDCGPNTPPQIALASMLLGMKACEGVLLHVAPTADGIAARRGDLDAMHATLNAKGSVSTRLVQGDPRRVLREELARGSYGLAILGRDRHRAGDIASELLRESSAMILVAPPA